VTSVPRKSYQKDVGIATQSFATAVTVTWIYVTNAIPHWKDEYLEIFSTIIHGSSDSL
jgi:hypothetical protein